jgi:hypothetical protein
MAKSDWYSVAIMLIGVALSSLLPAPAWGLLPLWVGVAVFLFTHLSGHPGRVHRESTRRTKAARRLFDSSKKMVDNALAHPADDPQGLLELETAWTKATRRQLAYMPWVTESEKADFTTITPFTPRGMAGSSFQHAQALEIVMERVDRLKKIAKRLESTGITVNDATVTRTDVILAAIVVVIALSLTIWKIDGKALGIVRPSPVVERHDSARIFVGLKDPEEWSDAQGKRYAQSSHPMDAASAGLTVKVGESQSLNPCVGPLTVEELVNAVIYVEFEEGIEVKPDGWWVLNSGTSTGGLVYEGHLSPINPGECAGGQAVLRFRASHAGLITIRYTVTALNLPPAHSETRILAR